MFPKCKIRSAVWCLLSVVVLLLLASVVCRPSSVCAADAIGVPSALNTRLLALEGSIASNGNVLALQAATNAINMRVGTAETTLATTTGAVAVVQGTLATATGNVATLQGDIIAQADTNATTTATAYTPRFVGDVLIGGAGVGTNAVWIAKGVTTNDWVALKP